MSGKEDVLNLWLPLSKYGIGSSNTVEGCFTLGVKFCMDVLFNVVLDVDSEMSALPFLRGIEKLLKVELEFVFVVLCLDGILQFGVEEVCGKMTGVAFSSPNEYGWYCLVSSRSCSLSLLLRLRKKKK